MATVFAHVLVATDFSDSSQRAIDTAADIALALGSKLTLVHVWQMPVLIYGGIGLPADWAGEIESDARKALDEALARVRTRVPKASSILRSGAVAPEISVVAERCDADLVVIGTHGRSGVKHLLLGSVAERVVRTCPVPVLTVRG